MDTIILLHIFLILFNLFLYNLLIYRPFWVTLFVTVSVKDEQRESTWKWRREKGQAGSHDTLARATVSPPSQLQPNSPSFQPVFEQRGSWHVPRWRREKDRKSARKRKRERDRERESLTKHISPLLLALSLSHMLMWVCLSGADLHLKRI